MSDELAEPGPAHRGVPAHRPGHHRVGEGVHVSEQAEQVAQFLEQVAAEVRQYGLAECPTLQRTAEAATANRAWGKSRYRIDVTIDRKDVDELAEQQRRFADSPVGQAFARMAGELRRR